MGQQIAWLILSVAGFLAAIGFTVSYVMFLCFSIPLGGFKSLFYDWTPSASYLGLIAFSMWVGITTFPF